MKVIKKSEEYNLNKIFGIKKVEKWIQNYPILKSKQVEKWIQDKIDKYCDEGKDPINFAVTSYLSKLQQYCIYNQVEDPSELLNEDIDERNLRLKKYLKFLSEEKTTKKQLEDLSFRKRPSDVSIRNLIQSRIKSFFSNRGFPISYNKRSRKSGANKGEISLTKDLIKKIQNKLESSNYKLICKFESQLGLRIGDILQELTKEVNKKPKYIIERYKNKHYFIRNFLTKKRNVIINYLFLTEELADTIKAIMGLDNLTKLDLTQLFLTRRIDKQTNKHTRIKSNDYLQRLKGIIRELGFNEDDIIKTHCFRKYYISQIGRASNELSDPRILTHFEGHEASFNDQAYLRMIQDIESYYNEWLKVESLICVDCIMVNKTNEEVLKLKEANIKLEEQIDIVLKGKIEYEKRIQEEINKVKSELSSISSKKEEKVITEFSKKLLNGISNFGKTKTIHDELLTTKEDGSFDSQIYINAIISNLINIAKKEILKDLK